MADSTTTGALAGAVAVVATLGTAAVSAWRERRKVPADVRKVDAETEQIIVDTAERLVSSVRQQLDRLERDHARCQDDIEDLRKSRRADQARIGSLEQALRDHNIPIPAPPPTYSPQVQRRRDYRDAQRRQPEGDTT